MNSSLEQLIREMKPQLRAGEWAFCVLPDGQRVPDDAVAIFKEAEGTTIIVPYDNARGLEPRYIAAWITLNVYSDLDAVGFLAAISRVLAAEGISCNVFSAVHHDHLFVPFAQGKRAVEVLRHLSAHGSSNEHD